MYDKTGYSNSSNNKGLQELKVYTTALIKAVLYDSDDMEEYLPELKCKVMNLSIDYAAYEHTLHRLVELCKNCLAKNKFSEPNILALKDLCNELNVDFAIIQISQVYEEKPEQLISSQKTKPETEPKPIPKQNRTNWSYWLLGVAAVVVIMLVIENSRYAFFTPGNNDYLEIDAEEVVADSTFSIDEGLKNINDQGENSTEVEQQQQTSGTFRDSRDGKTYRWVKIGDQVWMAENLAYKPSSGNYWAYDNNHSNVAKYGYLYDWQTACKICPTGWRLPSNDEWVRLNGFINNVTMLKTRSGWNSNGNGTDDYNFSALPGGERDFNGDFTSLGSWGYWWSSAEYGTGAWSCGVGCVEKNLETKAIAKRRGLSVRCVKD